MTTHARTILALAALGALALCAGCRHRDHESAVRDGGPDVPIAGQHADADSADAAREAADAAADSADAAREAAATDHPSEPDVLAITNRKGTIVLGLREDTVYMRLSDSVLAKADEKLDSTRASGALGSWIEKTVKGTVRQALSHQVAYALDEIDDIRYSGGAIRFDYRKRHAFSFEDLKVDNEPVLQSFDPDEARQFVAAVRDAKRGT